MAFEQKPNTAVLFPNQRKQKETHPDYTGHGNYNGVEFEISAWKKGSRNGGTFLSIALKEPYQKPARQDDIRDNWD